MPIERYGTDSAMTLLELNDIIEQLVVTPQTKGIWVTAETADLSRKRHCYMELIQKDDAGNTIARSRAAIWANSLYYIDVREGQNVTPFLSFFILSQKSSVKIKSPYFKFSSPNS